MTNVPKVVTLVTFSSKKLKFLESFSKKKQQKSMKILCFQTHHIWCCWLFFDQHKSIERYQALNIVESKHTRQKKEFSFFSIFFLKKNIKLVYPMAKLEVLVFYHQHHQQSRIRSLVQWRLLRNKLSWRGRNLEKSKKIKNQKFSS